MLFHEDILKRFLYSIPVISVYILIFIILLLYYPGYKYLMPSNGLLNAIIHIDFVMILWSYTKSIITDPGSILYSTDNKSLSSIKRLCNLNNEPKSQIRQGSYCMKCRKHRPARTHHCSICNKCILRMDHHCPWIGNCVGLYNHRYFLQFLIYASIDTTILAGCFIEVLLKLQGDCNLYTYLGFFWSTGIGIFLIALGAYNLWAICMNTNSLELRDLTDKSIYDIGWKNNFLQICGHNYIGYFLPIKITMPTTKSMLPV